MAKETLRIERPLVVVYEDAEGITFPNTSERES